MLKHFLSVALILVFSLSYAGTRKDCKTEDADPSTYSKVSATPIAKTSLEELKSNFNRDKNSVRVVTLLSPTCRYCQSGQTVVKDLFSKYTSKDLKGYVVWLPMLSHDDDSAATSRSRLIADKRIEQGWDEKREIGERFEKTLKLTKTAWDVYLIYPPGVTWEGELPPTPGFWMHQLGKKDGADPKLCLNPARLSRELNKQLEKLKQANSS